MGFNLAFKGLTYVYIIYGQKVMAWRGITQVANSQSKLTTDKEDIPVPLLQEEFISMIGF